MAGIRASGILSQPHSSSCANGLDGEVRRGRRSRYRSRFRCPIHAAGGVAKGLEWRSLYAATNLQVAASYPHAIGELEISLRNRAQESAVAESDGRAETRRHSHRRFTKSP